MNEVVKAPTRRKWTLAELDRLSAHGFFGEHEHVELIGGELITMPAKAIRHERIRGIVSKWMSRHLPPSLEHYQELGWRPGAGMYLEPDLLVTDADAVPPAISPAKVALVVEFAKSSLDYDHGLKAMTYATMGVADYWVVNAVTLSTRIHREPSSQGFRSVVELPATAQLVPLLAPQLTLRLADFEFDDDGLGEEDP